MYLIINLESSLGCSQSSPTLGTEEHILSQFATTSSAIRHTSPSALILKTTLDPNKMLDRVVVFVKRGNGFCICIDCARIGCRA